MEEPEFTAAGVLPYAVYKRQLFFFLGQERYQYLAHNKIKSRLVWSDFGGMKQPGETEEQTAAREFAEETLGMFEDLRCTPASIKRCAEKMAAQLCSTQRSSPVFKVSNGCYRQFVARVDYQEAFMFSVAASNTFEGRSTARPSYAEYMQLWQARSPASASSSPSSMPPPLALPSPTPSWLSPSRIGVSDSEGEGEELGDTLKKEKLDYAWVPAHLLEAALQLSLRRHGKPRPSHSSLPSQPLTSSLSQIASCCASNSASSLHSSSSACCLSSSSSACSPPACPFLHHKNHVVCHVDARPLRLFHKFVITLRNLDFKAMLLELCAETGASESLTLLTKPTRQRHRKKHHTTQGDQGTRNQRKRARRSHARQRGEEMDNPPFFVLDDEIQPC